jgi:hypothetical protein
VASFNEHFARQLSALGRFAHDCDAENTCHICELQWDNSQNAVRKCQKCTCCETTQEEYLLPVFSMFDPVTPNGSKDEYRNQHIWSLSMDNSKLEKCLTPETTSN